MRNKEDNEVLLRQPPLEPDGREVCIRRLHVRTLLLMAEDRSVEQVAELERISVASVRKRLTLIRSAMRVQSLLASYHKFVLAGILVHFSY